MRQRPDGVPDEEADVLGDPSEQTAMTLDVEVRAMGANTRGSALAALDRAGGLHYPMTALAVPAARVAEMVPLVQGTGLDLVAVHEEPLDDVSHRVRWSMAAGADEVEVPWSALTATVDALGFDTPISCDITSVQTDDRAAIAELAFGRGAQLLRCSIDDLPALVAVDRVHQQQRVKVDATGHELSSVVDILSGHAFGHPTRLSFHA